jgi:hypothetical protein
VGEPPDTAHVPVQADDEVAGAHGAQRQLHARPSLADDHDLRRSCRPQRTVGARCPERCVSHPRPISMLKLPDLVTVGGRHDRQSLVRLTGPPTIG